MFFLVRRRVIWQGLIGPCLLDHSSLPIIRHPTIPGSFHFRGESCWAGFKAWHRGIFRWWRKWPSFGLRTWLRKSPGHISWSRGWQAQERENSKGQYVERGWKASKGFARLPVKIDRGWPYQFLRSWFLKDELGHPSQIVHKWGELRGWRIIQVRAAARGPGRGFLERGFLGSQNGKNWFSKEGRQGIPFRTFLYSPQRDSEGPVIHYICHYAFMNYICNYAFFLQEELYPVLVLVWACILYPVLVGVGWEAVTEP